VAKACTLGVIIDATNAYFDEFKNRFVKKIKIIDESLNTTCFNPHYKYLYLTVFFYSHKAENLPNPRTVGDLLYLRRFSFGKYNDGFQAHYVDLQYCSWAVLPGDTNSLHTEEYQTSKTDIKLDDEKYGNLAGEVR
jgi:hypothetical protein